MPSGSGMAAVTEVHEHVVERHLLVTLRGGVPYEVERKICRICLKVISETPVKRAVA